MLLLNQSIWLRKNIQGHLPATAQGHIASLYAYSREDRIMLKWLELQDVCTVWMSKWLEELQFNMGLVLKTMEGKKSVHFNIM